MRRTALFVVCTLALALCAGSAAAQAYPDTFKVTYFANANTPSAPDGTLRLTNPGTGAGNVCASIYVYDPTQELSECCSCLLTPDGLRTLSVNTDLTGNPLTGVVLTTGVIEIVSTTPVAGVCPLPTAVKPESALRAWATHVQNSASAVTAKSAADAANSTFAVTETGAADATLSAGEISLLARDCTAAKIIGSGKGVCTCGTGD